MRNLIPPAGDNPTGTIEFRLYGFNAACSGTPVDDVTVTVDGDGSYTTPNPYMPSFSGPDEGEFCWTATYSGDANNTPATAYGAAFYQIGLVD
jgi:hypothetical protein